MSTPGPLPFEADLHNHTTFSDGECTPTELLQWAHALGLRAVAITDHDTLDGLAEGLQASARTGVELLCGVEITTRFVEPLYKGSLHLLVYFSEALLADTAFVEQTRQVLSRGRGAALTRDRIAEINRCFAPGADEPLLPRPLSEADVYAHGDLISRRHFALALKDLGIADRALASRIIGNDSPAYIPSGVPAEDLQPYLGAWPLVRVLAHPAAGSFPGESHYKEVLPPYETVAQLLPRFSRLGLHGLEVAYPGHDAAWTERMSREVERLGLAVATGGSDCHDRQQRPLGVRGVTAAVVRRLRELM